MADLMNYSLTNPTQSTVSLAFQVVRWNLVGDVNQMVVLLDRTGANAITATLPTPPAFLTAAEKQIWFDNMTAAIDATAKAVANLRFP
jgi:hypothetical protein